MRHIVDVDGRGATWWWDAWRYEGGPFDGMVSSGLTVPDRVDPTEFPLGCYVRDADRPPSPKNGMAVLVWNEPRGVAGVNDPDPTGEEGR